MKTATDINAALMKLWQAEADEQDGGHTEAVKPDHGRSYENTVEVLTRATVVMQELMLALTAKDWGRAEKALDGLDNLDAEHPVFSIEDFLEDVEDVVRAAKEYL